jgi:hypothetical protein
MDIEAQLRAGLSARASDIGAASPDLAEDVVAGYRRQQRRRAVAVGAGVIAAAAAVLIPLTVTGAGSDTVAQGPASTTSAAGVEASYQPYDVAPRGNLAANDQYVQELLNRPWSTLPEFAGPPVQTRHVVYVNDGVDGVNALVIGWQDGAWQGLWLQGPAGSTVDDLESTGDAVPVDPDYTSRYTGSQLVMLGRPGDLIEVSPRQDIAADGSIVPAPFQTVSNSDGTATVPGAGLGTARIRVTRDGAVVADTVQYGGQYTQEGSADQLDLSPALEAAAGEPEEPLVRLTVQSVLNQLGLSPADVEVGVRWGGPIGNNNLDATAAIVTVQLPSGATVIVGTVGSQQQAGDTWVSITPCARQILPAGVDPATELIGMRCDLTSLANGASLGNQIIVVPPAGAASIGLTGSSGRVLDTRQLTGPAYVGPAPDGLSGVTAADPNGTQLAANPLLTIDDLQLTD